MLAALLLIISPHYYYYYYYLRHVPPPLMEEDSISTGLEWENLALYTARPMHLGFSSSLDHDDTHTTSVAFLSSKYHPPPPPPPPPPSSASTSHMIGLRLGDPFPPRTSIPVSSTPAKRSRASYHNMQNPCCQVEGCNLDLKLAKDYHRRHRICEAHSKSPKVVVAGMERRFCQQCSRFHDLSEFDDKKRSCRRRLSDHNARRRRVQPDSALLTSAALSHSSYADHRQQNVLLNGLPISLSNPRWENANTPILRNNSLIRPISNLHMDPTSNSRILDQCASTNHPSMAAPDRISAHSLLSSNPWSFNEGKSEPDPHHFTLFQSSIGLEQGPPHQEEYQLFKDPYDSSTFYSTQRSL